MTFHAWASTPKLNLLIIYCIARCIYNLLQLVQKSRRLLRLYVEHLEREGIALPQVPLPLKLYVNELTPKPDGYQYPRNAWVQLNRRPNHLHTGVGRFKKPLQGTIVFFYNFVHTIGCASECVHAESNCYIKKQSCHSCFTTFPNSTKKRK